MHRVIANYDLIPNINELINKDNLLIPELELTAHILHQCSVGSLFSKKDFREFIVRLCLRYGLFNPQESYFENDHILTAELRDSGEKVIIDPKKIERFIGLVCIEGRLHTASRESFLENLVNGQRSAIWTEIFSPFIIHQWEDKKNSKGDVVISVKENTPEVTKEHVLKAEAFADFIIKDFDDEVFHSFHKKNNQFIRVLQRMENEIGTIKFDIRAIPKDFLKIFVLFMRGEKLFDKELFDAYDEDEYDIEFKLMKLVWVVAMGYTEEEYYMGIPRTIHIDPRVEFDHGDYEGLMDNDSGGINILQTYLDYNLQSVVKELKPLVQSEQE